MTSASSLPDYGKFVNDPIMQQLAAQQAAGVPVTKVRDNPTTNAVAWLDTLSSVSQNNNAQAALATQEARDWNAQMTKQVMEFNSAEAAKNRDWQLMASSSAHQREVADLKAAGLNPVLSAMGGNGAAVTSGASASASAPTSQAAQTDMSTNNALVNILGNILAAQTSIENTRTNAEASMAMAMLSAETSKLVAQISGGNSLAVAKYNASAQSALSAQNYGQNLYTQAQKYKQDSALSAQQHKQSMEQAEKYPTSAWGTANSAVQQTARFIDSLLNDFKSFSSTKTKSYNNLYE